MPNEWLKNGMKGRELISYIWEEVYITLAFAAFPIFWSIRYKTVENVAASH